MRRGLVAFGALTLVGLGLTGCGLFRFEQREPWRTQAEEACMSQHLVQPSAYMAASSKIDGPGACGMDYPFKVAAFSNGSVGLKQKVTLACPIIPRIEIWLDEVVKPAAVMYYGVPVIDLKAGSYSCRPRNNQVGAKVSEHAFGNALDVMAFVLADGREVSVEKGWRGTPDDQEFLREVFVGACRHFSTVLAPGSDAFHYNHLHLDLARHDPRGERRICKPILKFTPRLDVAQAAGRAPPSATATADLPPIDLDEDPQVDEPSSAPARPVAAPPASAPRPAYASGVFAAPPAAYPAMPPAPTPPARPASAPAPMPLYNRPPAEPQVLNGHGLY
jgi:hypothetical protein